MCLGMLEDHYALEGIEVNGLVHGRKIQSKHSPGGCWSKRGLWASVFPGAVWTTLLLLNPFCCQFFCYTVVAADMKQNQTSQNNLQNKNKNRTTNLSQHRPDLITRLNKHKQEQESKETDIMTDYSKEMH